MLIVIIRKGAVEIGIHQREHADGIRVHRGELLKPIHKGIVGNIGRGKIGARFGETHVHAVDIKQLALFLADIPIDIAVIGCVKGHKNALRFGQSDLPGYSGVFMNVILITGGKKERQQR